MNTYQELKLNNGKTIKLTFYLKKLLTLKTTKKELYDKVNKTIMEGITEVLDVTDVLYACYLFALKDDEKEMSYDEFLEVVPSNINELMPIYTALIYPKKK